MVPIHDALHWSLAIICHPGGWLGLGAGRGRVLGTGLGRFLMWGQWVGRGGRREGATGWGQRCCADAAGALWWHLMLAQ